MYKSIRNIRGVIYIPYKWKSIIIGFNFLNVPFISYTLIQLIQNNKKELRKPGFASVSQFQVLYQANHIQHIQRKMDNG